MAATTASRLIPGGSSAGGAGGGGAGAGGGGGAGSCRAGRVPSSGGSHWSSAGKTCPRLASASAAGGKKKLSATQTGPEPCELDTVRALNSPSTTTSEPT